METRVTFKSNNNKLDVLVSVQCLEADWDCWDGGGVHRLVVW